MRLEELVDRCAKRGNVISVVGAGGKTTLIEYLARQCSAKGLRVLVSTTTHMYYPPAFFADHEEAVKQYWERETYAVIGTLTPQGKITMAESSFYAAVSRQADVVFLESDGAKRMPLKVPADHEPVLLQETNLVLGVAGMSALNQRAEEGLFRLEEAKKHFTVEKEDKITKELIEQIICSEWGSRKHAVDLEFIAVLNQCDREELLCAAEEIADGLKKKGIEAVCTALKQI